MIVVGIAGGIASGKSRVAEMFVSLGATVLDADKIGHDVLRTSEVIAKARHRWGDAVVRANGELDRRAIASRVFGSSQEAATELAFWEQTVHPAIGTELESRIDQLRREGKCDVVILDAAVMFKTGWHRHCDRIVFVDAPESVRRQRAKERGWTDEEFTIREQAQTKVEEKRRLAHFVIDNTGSFDQTYHQVRTVWSALSPGNSPPQ